MSIKIEIELSMTLSSAQYEKLCRVREKFQEVTGELLTTPEVLVLLLEDYDEDK